MSNAEVFTKLNELAKVYLKDINLAELVPFEIKHDCSITLVPNNGDLAFNLNPPIGGIIKTIDTNSNNQQGAVTRQLVAYSKAVELINNPQTFNFWFSGIINSALGTLTRYMGNLSDREVTTNPSGYFYETQSYAAYEFRILVKPKEEKGIKENV